MHRIERKIDIESSPERIFGIVMDPNIISKWNPAVDLAEQRDENLILKTSIGDLNIINTESEENKYMTIQLEKGNVDSIGYILTPKKEKTEVMLWSEFDDKKFIKAYKDVEDLVLKSLKQFSEYLEDGGNPDDYDKKQLLAVP
ncbi:MAG: hypothetical protein ACFFA3_14295 [Promethearchaeota archaeon]